MMVIDTNILVRYLVKDDKPQERLATQFLREHPCLILKTVLLEVVWVLSSKTGYNLPRETVVSKIRHLLRLPNVTMEDLANVVLALEWYEEGMDFADALHLSSSLNASGFATFDGKVAKKATLLNIHHPVILLSTE
jgi:predicted nucleic-acid-binding protein